MCYEFVKSIGPQTALESGVRGFPTGTGAYPGAPVGRSVSAALPGSDEEEILHEETVSKEFMGAVVLGLVLTACAQLDHFAIYEVKKTEVEFKVLLTGQLDQDPKVNVLVALTHFANPTRKVHPGAEVGVRDTNAHFTGYALQQEEAEPRRTVRYENQLGQHSVDIRDPRLLLVPAQKTSDENSEFPAGLDHYKCYEVVVINTVPPPPVATLGDQFGSQENVQIGEPKFFCVPVMKEREGQEPHDIQNAADHLAIYAITPMNVEPQITTRDQFGDSELQVVRKVLLAIPSEKQVVVAHDD